MVKLTNRRIEGFKSNFSLNPLCICDAYFKLQTRFVGMLINTIQKIKSFYIPYKINFKLNYKNPFEQFRNITKVPLHSRQSKFVFYV